jgi:hypothetical protein
MRVCLTRASSVIMFFHTQQQNVLHVTIAGIVGTWWFAPQEASSMWSPAIQDSFRRATSTSFGSICMGSLLVAIIQALKSLASSARRHGNNTLLVCIVECVLYYIAKFADYFNKWAFIYVGLYGYDYVTAGRKVITLFQERGWTTIISDNLVARVLVLVCMAIGAVTGLVGMLLHSVTGWATASLGEDANVAVFFICFLIGISLSTITLGVVYSATNTVIVLFAEAPLEFETNHPRLCQNMMQAWRQVYPNECGF